MCDLNPLTRSVLASADAATSFKILALKMVLVLICACLDTFSHVQVIISLLCATGVSTLLLYDVPYYSTYVNMVTNGLWGGLLLVAGLLAALVFSLDKHADTDAYATSLTWVRSQLGRSSSSSAIEVLSEWLDGCS
eukprot:GHRQ01021921.1.p1 GENE.GHRQ01021921.1~~GHRQ01021921.1.p1  ORF type:complete len:136 (+),score=19.46 GHRQ01021921.1:184-591(+)